MLCCQHFFSAETVLIVLVLLVLIVLACATGAASHALINDEKVSVNNNEPRALGGSHCQAGLKFANEHLSVLTLLHKTPSALLFKCQMQLKHVPVVNLNGTCGLNALFATNGITQPA